MTRFPVSQLVAQPFAFLLRTAAIPDMPKVMGESFGALSAALAKAKAAPAGMPLAHYIAYDSNSTTFEVGFPVRPEDVEAVREAGLSIGKTAEGQVMTAIHMGPYDSVVSTYNAMQAEMQAAGLEAAMDMWEVYYSPPDTPPAEIRTDVIWPVRNKP